MTALLLWALLAQEAAPPPAAETAPAPSAEAAETVFEEEPPLAKMRRLPLQPYRIRFWLTPEAHPRISPAVVADVREGLANGFSRAYAGAAELSFGVAPAGAAESPGAPNSDMPDAALFPQDAAAVDKIMWIGLETGEFAAGAPKLVAIAREYDVEFKSWGPARRKAVVNVADFADAAANAALRQFRARLAVTDLADGKKYRVAVQGMALQAADSPTPLLPPGTPVRLRRDLVKKDKLVGVQDIPVTYFIYRTAEPDRMAAVGNYMSSLRAPVEPAMLRRGRVLGLAMAVSEDAQTEIQFVEMQKAIAVGAEAGKRPLVAYEVQIRPQDQAQPIALGSTDRRGRANVTAAMLAGRDGEIRPRACEVRLLVGSVAIKSFPLVPGDGVRREVVCAPDPYLPEFNAKIGALQNDIVASLAAYAYKSKLLYKRKEECDKYQSEFDENDIKGLKYIHKLLQEINALPKNDVFSKRLDALEAEAKSKLNKELGQKQLSKPVANLIEGMRKLLKEKNIGRDLAIKFPDGFDPKMPDPPPRDPKKKKRTVDVPGPAAAAPPKTDGN